MIDNIINDIDMDAFFSYKIPRIKKGFIFSFFPIFSILKFFERR
jgi:hypothetical protein